VGGTYTTPQLVSSITGPIGIVAAGYYHSLVVTDTLLGIALAMYAFGRGSEGQLGVGSYPAAVATPIAEISLLPNLLAAGGFHSLAVTGISSLNLVLNSCGDNSVGALGLGLTLLTDVFTPCISLSVLLGIYITAVAAGYQHSLAIVGVNVVVFGSNSDGQLCTSTSLGSAITTPLTLSIGSPNTLAAGFSHSVMSFGTSALWTCGSNDYGQLGVGSTTNADSPQSVTGWGAQTVKAIAAGQKSTVVTTTAGNLYTFGQNSFGQLGLGNYTNQLTPTLVTPPWLAGHIPSIIAASNGTIVVA